MKTQPEGCGYQHINLKIMLTAETKIKNRTKKPARLHQNSVDRQETELNTLFPVFLKLENLNTLIIGGGSVSLEKLLAVLKNSPEANVTLIAPSIKKEIFLLAEQHQNVQIVKRDFNIEDFESKDVIISATNNKELNKFIREEAKKRKILINVADTPELCDFYLSSVVQKGSVKLAISTNGKSPTIAKRFREILDNAIPDEMENVLDNLVKIRSKLNGNFSEKVKTLNRITSVLVEDLPAKKQDTERGSKLFHYLLITSIILLTIVMGYLILHSLPGGFDALEKISGKVLSSADEKLPWFLLTGFFAQLIDGALGMAYGVSATTFLLALGIPPAAASASVHTSEIFTCGASGLFHLKFGNVSIKLFKNLLLPGILGAALGAYVLSSLSGYNFIIKPLVASYTLILGGVIFYKALKKQNGKNQPVKNKISHIKQVVPLAGLGGFLDSVGGGGWGPIVTSTLIAKGKNPLVTIGSVNLAEFFVAFASSATFITLLGFSYWQLIIGLVVGGVIAAPVAAKIAGKLPARTMMFLVGLLVVLVSLRTIYTIIF